MEGCIKVLARQFISEIALIWVKKGKWNFLRIPLSVSSLYDCWPRGIPSESTWHAGGNWALIACQSQGCRGCQSWSSDFPWRRSFMIIGGGWEIRLNSCNFIWCDQSLISCWIIPVRFVKWNPTTRQEGVSKVHYLASIALIFSRLPNTMSPSLSVRENVKSKGKKIQIVQ